MKAIFYIFVLATNAIKCAIFNSLTLMCLLSVFNLSQNIDVDETRRQIEQYKRENQSLIKKNKSKLVSYSFMNNRTCEIIVNFIDWAIVVC